MYEQSPEPIWYIPLKLNEIHELQEFGCVSSYQECSPAIHLATNEAERVATRLVGAGFPAIPEVGINTRRSQREPE
jgi:hypothetical protein